MTTNCSEYDQTNKQRNKLKYSDKKKKKEYILVLANFVYCFAYNNIYIFILYCQYYFVIDDDDDDVVVVVCLFVCFCCG